MFRWCNNFLNKKVIRYSDNTSAVSWMNKGTSRNRLIQFMCCIFFGYSQCTIVLSLLVTFQVNKTVWQMHVPAFMSLDKLLNFFHKCLHCSITLFQSQDCCLTCPYHFFLLGGFTVQMLQDQASDLKRKAWLVVQLPLTTIARNLSHFAIICDLPSKSQML